MYKLKNSNIIAFANQKGGVGKTTSVLNLASAFGKLGQKILVIDLDPQGNATSGSGVDKNTLKSSLYDVLLKSVNIRDAILNIDNCKFDLLPSNRNLAGAEVELVELESREFILKDALEIIRPNYNLILIDCPPSLSLLTLNGLVAANFLLIPMQCEYYALEGLTDLLNTMSHLKATFNPNLEILGIIRTMLNSRSKLSSEVSDELTNHFGTKVLKNFIPRNVRLAEAPSFGLPAVLLDPGSTGSKAYMDLATELLNILKKLR